MTTCDRDQERLGGILRKVQSKLMKSYQVRNYQILTFVSIIWVRLTKTKALLTDNLELQKRPVSPWPMGGSLPTFSVILSIRNPVQPCIETQPFVFKHSLHCIAADHLS